MKIKSISPYRGPQEDDGLVTVYDVTVKPSHLYTVRDVLVSNSKRISMLDVNALLAHGATENLQDVGVVRGQENPDYWLKFMNGHTPGSVKIPGVYQGFVNRLKAAGINVVDQDNRTNVMALTRKDVAAMTGDRVIRRGDTVHWDDQLKPVPGGLFDPKLTGGHGGNQWAAIELPEPMPNPVMEEPIRRILGLTQKQFSAVLSGDHQVSGFGTGPRAIAKALDNIDLDREIAKSKGEYKSASPSKKDEAIRRWKYLESAKKMGLHPGDWVLDRVPVLPPAFRPVSLMGQGVPLVNDANYLYKELLDANDNYARMRPHVGETGLGAERLAVYNSFKAVTGLGEPVHPKLVEKGVKGILKSIFGSSPKTGTVQRKLLASTVDNVGRATITPNPDFDMDTVGIPENQAFDVYSRFVVRGLRRQGLPVREALRHVRDRTPLAREMLQQEMGERPVYINRAPVLHKYGIMAFRPRLVKGDVLQVSPLIVKGFNADFDGDAMQFHVPTTREAVDEAYEKMLPSRNILSPADFKTPVNVPGQEYLGGLYRATSPGPEGRKKKAPQVFRSRKDVVEAFARGDVDDDTPITVME